MIKEWIRILVIGILLGCVAWSAGEATARHNSNPQSYWWGP